MKKQKSLIAQELGRKGGIATLEKYGRDYYVKMAENRWRDVKPPVDNSVKKGT